MPYTAMLLPELDTSQPLQVGPKTHRRAQNGPLRLGLEQTARLIGSKSRIKLAYRSITPTKAHVT
ncbi:protein of unknown function [Methylocaldum szegediense]|uniref:Transposase n=1 Tax=Methylocaldum szegediense TaxID=73780 RepID=A0ABM9HYA1_9GAMM|nr:protein of unknown function [Methylocaldum szegediense]